MTRKSVFWAWMLLLFWGLPAWAQGVLIVVNHPHPIPLPRPFPPPRPVPPPVSYRIKELGVQAKVSEQVARVQVTQSFVNTGSIPMEVRFVFPLPYDGAVDRLTFLVDGQEIEAKLLPAAEARSIYESHIRRNQDPALLEWIGTGMFQTSVFPVPPGAERKVNLRYNQLLRKQGKLVDFLFPLSTAKYTAQPIERLSFELALESQEKIKSVYSPTHPINVKRSDEHHAVVTWEASQAVPQADFRLFYDVEAGKLGASVVSYRPDKGDDGYFLLLASPEFQTKSEDLAKKTVVFVVDRSGSMTGKKIDQAKEALRFVLNNLREGDLFNIVAYDSEVETFRPELQRFNEETRKEATGFVEGIYAGGSTNIDQALTVALGMLQDGGRPNYVLFLTDGLPTVGERNEVKIVANASEHNKLRARILSFGVGYDVNSRLLDRLVHENAGLSQYVRPDEDLEQHVSTFYSRISAPVMTDVQVTLDVEGSATEQGKVVNRVYPARVNDLFAGEQLVLVGRYRRDGQAKVVIRGRVGSEEQSFDFPASLVAHSADQSDAFVEKLWAIRRIGEIIDELDLRGKNEELIQELVALSTKHGILTPYTSFLADEVQRGDLADTRRLYFEAEGRVDRLNEAAGRAAFAQRAEKQMFRQTDSLAGGAIATAPAAGPDGRGGLPPGGAGSAGTPGVRFRDIESDKEVVVNTVLQIGAETLYKQGQRWIAANARDVDVEKQKAEVTVIERFSDDYFALVAANTAAENAVLAAQGEQEELLIRLRGKAYLLK